MLRYATRSFTLHFAILVGVRHQSMYGVDRVAVEPRRLRICKHFALQYKTYRLQAKGYGYALRATRFWLHGGSRRFYPRVCSCCV
jgi:hypothetical protein